MPPTICPDCNSGCSSGYPRPVKRPRRRQAGLTLIEVVVATAIFSITVASLLVVRGRAIEQTGRAKVYRTARRLSMQFLEEILGGKKYEEGESGAFDVEKHPGFFWHVKQIESMELKESELPFLQNSKEPGASARGGAVSGGDRQGAPGAASGGGGLAAMLGGAGKGMGDELFRYVIEVAYPAPTESGMKRFEVVTYHLKEADADAMAKALGGALGGSGGGAPGGGIGSLLGGDSR